MAKKIKNEAVSIYKNTSDRLGEAITHLKDSYLENYNHSVNESDSISAFADFCRIQLRMSNFIFDALAPICLGENDDEDLIS